ncbi:acyl carrier protein [Nigerium massiliense]|uniref:acyl carrier protein n=1 Tax=Nigerium massiliense TaxID=1522317 RepID=UPI0009E3D23C|nr:acyl carrier protein [Nigerium massiliense]
MGVGIDVAGVAAIADSYARFGQRYLTRVFTAAELAGFDALTERGRLERLSGCWAGKEAVAKALGRPAAEPLPWHWIEIRPDAAAGHRVVLHPELAAWAVARGVGTIDISIAPGNDRTLAVAIALEGDGHEGKATMEETIKDIVGQHAGIGDAANGLDADADLYELGMTSHASVNLMMALEDEFDIEFPDSMMRRETFESVAAIKAAVEKVQADEA